MNHKLLRSTRINVRTGVKIYDSGPSWKNDPYRQNRINTPSALVILLKLLYQHYTLEVNITICQPRLGEHGFLEFTNPDVNLKRRINGIVLLYDLLSGFSFFIYF